MTLATDSLNPKFVYFSPVETPVRDCHGLAEHVDHAIIAFDGRAPFAGDCAIERLGAPIESGTLRVDLWVNALDDYSCTYGFLCSTDGGRTPVARGERCVVNVDPASHRPAKWPPEFRHAHAELLKDLPAYA